MNEVEELKSRYSEIEKRDIERRLMESDKSVSIKDATDDQLAKILQRLEMETQAQSLIRRLKRNSMSEYDQVNDGMEVSTETPVKDLYHYGILGMKWGKRKSGTGKTSLRSRVEKRKIEESEDYKQAKKIRRKKVSEMSNKELQDLTRRLQLEQQYKNMNPSAVKKGSGAVGKFVGSAVKEVAKEALKNVIKSQIQSALSGGGGTPKPKKQKKSRTIGFTP